MTRAFAYIPSERHLLPPDRFHLDGSVPEELASELNRYGLHTTAPADVGLREATANEHLQFADAENRTLITTLPLLEVYLAAAHAGVFLAHRRVAPAEFVSHLCRYYPLLVPFDSPLEKPVPFVALS